MRRLLWLLLGLLCSTVLGASGKDDADDADPVDRTFQIEQLRAFQETFDNGNTILAGWTGSNYCSWRGVTCNSDGAVVEINVAGMGLKGTVPNLGWATVLPSGLQVLNLDSNSLTGELLPPSDFPLKLFGDEVKDVRLSRNQLSGSLDFLGNIFMTSSGSTLEVLDLAYNNFTGSIPARYQGFSPQEYKLPPRMKWMALQGNELSGTLPTFANSSNATRIFTLPGNEGLCGPTPEAPRYVDERGDAVTLPSCSCVCRAIS